MTAPPPIVTTTSAPCRRPDATPARTSSTVGSSRTAKTAAAVPRLASSRSCRPGLPPVHTSTRDPSPDTTAGSSAARPAPKTTRDAVANSNVTPSPRAALPPLVTGREDGGELRRLARHGHHLRDRIPPGSVVGRQLVGGRGRFIAVNLGQHHVRRVSLIADDVEPQHARFGQ